MQKRRVATASLGLALALVAAACGSSKKSESTATTKAGTATTAAGAAGASGCPTIPGAGTQTAKALKKIALVFDAVGRGDGGFNDAAACGFDAAKKDFGVTGTEQVPKADGSDRADKLSLVCKDGNNPVIAVGFLFGDALKQVATTDCKTTQFGIIDSTVDGVDNVAGLVFAQNEGSFLVGAIAALKSKSGKIGFVGGLEGDLIKEFQAGYEAGAKAAKADIKISSKYAGTTVAAFSDPAKGKEIAKAMIDDGVDVIYTAAGSTGTGAFQAVKEAQDAKKVVWAIGVDSDQGKPNVKNNVPEEVKPYIISSMLKRVDVAVYNTMKAVNEGTFKGGAQVFNLKNGGIDYSTTGGKIDDIKSKIDDFKKQIIDGKITVPTKPGA